MATDATFDNQLQALATATANFANGKDAQIKNTIITALGGSGGSGKTEGVITLTGTAVTTRIENGETYYFIDFAKTSQATINYNGDGTLRLVHGRLDSGYEASINGTTLTFTDNLSYTGVVYAHETDNFTAAICKFQTLRNYDPE